MAREKATVCPGCGEHFKSLGLHWNRSSDCGYPELPEEIKWTLRFMAYAGRVEVPDDRYENPVVTKTTADEQYASFLVDSLGFMCRTTTAGHDTVHGRESYQVRSRTHPWNWTLVDELGEDPASDDR